MLQMTLPFFMIAAAVSSQDDSIARIILSLTNTFGELLVDIKETKLQLSD